MMPIARFQMPDGRIGRFEVPEGTTPEQAIQLIQGSLREIPDAEAAGKAAAAEHWRSLPTMDAFTAGVGKGFVDIGRGAGQLLRRATQIPGMEYLAGTAGPSVTMARKAIEAGSDFLPDQAAIDRAQAKEAGLMDRTAGKAGHLTGSVLASVPLAGAPGAATTVGAAGYGGLFGALQPTGTQDNPILQTLAGAAGGAGGQLIGKALPSIIRGVFDPFFPSGRERIVGALLNRFGGPDAAAKVAAGGRALVPGSQPTLAEAAGGGGIGGLQLAAQSSDPVIKEALQARQLANTAARVQALNGIAKDQRSLDLAKGVRSMMSEPLYESAMRKGIDQQAAAGMAPQIESLMQRPIIQQAIAEAKTMAANRGETLAPEGGMKGLQTAKFALDNVLGKADTKTSLGKAGYAAAAQAKQDFNAVLEQLSPDFAQANRNFASYSRPINQMQVGQALRDKLIPALMDSAAVPTRTRAQSYAQALRDAPDLIKQVTGQRGKTLNDLYTPGEVQTLENISADMARKAAAEDMSKTVGSTTAQNLAAQHLMQSIMGPLAGRPGMGSTALSLSTAGRPAAWFYGKFAEPKVQERLAQALLDPQDAVSLMTRQPTLPQWVPSAWNQMLTTGGMGLLPSAAGS